MSSASVCSIVMYFPNATPCHFEPLLRQRNAWPQSRQRERLKVLGNGKLTKKLTVEAKKVSNSAREKIEACGGKIEVK